LDRTMSDDAKALVQAMIEVGYDDFISKVAMHRNMGQADVDRVAQGQVWTGADALDHGLIDKLRGLEDAIVAAAELAELDADAYGLKYYVKVLTPAEQSTLQFLSSAASVGLDLKGLVNRPSSLDRVAGAVAEALSPMLRFNDP